MSYELISQDSPSNYENISARTVTGVLMDEEGKVVLLKHNKLGNIWVLPGGKTDYDESENNAIIREIREELGVEVNPDDLEPSVRIKFEWTMPGGEGFCTNQIFIIRKYQGEVRNVEYNKHSDLRWVSFEELVELTSIKTTAATEAYIQLLQEL
jgi:8-oxo-dGTP diphosphatase